MKIIKPCDFRRKPRLRASPRHGVAVRGLQICAQTLIRRGGAPSGVAFTVKNPLCKFWYTGACYEPGCTLFPPPPDFRGHNSEKCGTGPELLNDARREQMRSYLAMLQRPKAGGGMVWDAASAGSGICLHPPWKRHG